MKHSDKEIIGLGDWVPVKGFEGLYEISRFGEVRGIKRQGTAGGRIGTRENNKGYITIDLCKNGTPVRGILVHRLVAEAFLENPENLPFVNHKDENKSNNTVENLEWCDHEYNMNYGTAKERRIKTKGKMCKGVWPDGTTKIYKNCADAGRDLGLSQGSIWGCCNGRWKTSGGARWSYI